MARVILIILIILPVVVLSQNYSPLIYPGENGKLEYLKYANTGDTAKVNQVPDFSWAGYKSGGVKLPEVPVVLTVEPVEGDNRANIQQAIDKVYSMASDAEGIRGAILFKAGKYSCSGPVYVRNSGIVLRGEGQLPNQEGGTEFVATATSQHTLFNFEGNKPSKISAGFSLDTIFVPQMSIGDFNNDGKQDTIDGNVWLSAKVTSAAQLESDGDKILSLKIEANNGDFSSYHSKEAENKPYLKITYKMPDTEADSVITIFPSDDAFVQGGEYSDDNFGTDERLVIKNAGEGNRVTRKIFLKFILPEITGEVSHAELWLWCNNAGNTSTQQHYISFISNDSWGESTISYNNQPAAFVASSRILTNFVPVGSNSLEIENAGNFKPGDLIMVLRTPNQAWIDILQMAQYGWTADSYRIGYERTVTAVNGNRISIDVPMVQSIETRFGGGEVYKISNSELISNCGIENMWISSSYAFDEDENHGWIAVSMNYTENCWVKNVTAQYFGYGCVGLFGSNKTTVEECAMLDPKSITTGSRKYSFYIDKGSFNLFQRCYTRGGRHDYVTGSRVAGPNVFLDCLAEQTNADIGPHHRYATGILFDNIKGGETRVQNRKDMGSGHGWAGAQTMFWNIEAIDNDIKVESPIGAMNWGIGCVAPYRNGDGYWDNWGKHIQPRSLYLKQLEDRLGKEAVENVTTYQQQESDVWNILKQWKGIGKWLSDNARLSNLQINGITIDGFDPLGTEYTYSIPQGSTEIPEITFTPADTSASVSVLNATAIPGVTEITVTAENGITKKVYQVQITFATGTEIIQSSLLKVYPNPVSSQLTLTFPEGVKNKKYIVSSVSGKILFTGKCLFQGQKINVESLVPGMYLLTVEGFNSKVFIKK